ncbi:MAG: hypothetical protein HZA06_03330 [Nitrospirae bacterium]|nr:hypothetical protein [Nitrospirota bacterium]
MTYQGNSIFSSFITIWHGKCIINYPVGASKLAAQKKAICLSSSRVGCAHQIIMADENGGHSPLGNHQISKEVKEGIIKIKIRDKASAL